ncbi:SDR family oxidoreductase [Cytobacillus suaedae]|nr:SDR family oxidoreductase [Cytobacillus suaedae]
METILITGAGSGLGKELALQYANQGHHILLAGRTLDKLNDTEKEIRNNGGKATSYAVDIGDVDQVEKWTETILKTHKISYLINNAGVGYFGALASLTNRQVEEMIHTNITGTINVTKSLLPHLLAQPNSKIMNIISTAGQKGKVNESVYVACKFAIRGFTESLIKELEASSTSVTAVYMGGMDTPFWNNAPRHIKDKSRLPTPKEIASIIIKEFNGQAELFV